MKTRICKNCGSGKFNEVNGIIECIYCKTQYQDDRQGSGSIFVFGDGNVIGNDNVTFSNGPIPALRDALKRLDDAQIDGFCLYNLTVVYDKFSRGMRRDEKINLIMAHCRRQGDNNLTERLVKVAHNFTY